MLEMEYFMEELKKFLKDVEAYLSVTLKKEKLKKETNAKREELMKDLAVIFTRLSPTKIKEEDEEQEDYADVDVPTSSAPKNTNSDDDDDDECTDDIYEDTVPESTHSNDSSQQSSEDQDDDREDNVGMFDLDIDPYGDVKVDPIAASELTTPSKEGIMDKKRKEGQFGLQTWQKRYCIIKGNILYYYKKKTDKEQCNQIVLTGYQGRLAPEYDKKNKKKDCLFEVVCPAKRSYQFIAQNKKDMHEWIKAIAVASKLGPSSVDPLAKSTPNNSGGSEELLDELYEDTSAPAPANDENDEFGDFYEDLDAYQATKITHQAEPNDTNRASHIPEYNDEEGDLITDDIYEDVPQPSDVPQSPTVPPMSIPERPLVKSLAANKPLPPEPPQTSSPPPVPTTHRPAPPQPAITQPQVKPYSPHMQVKNYKGGKNIGSTAITQIKSKSAVNSSPAPPVPRRAEPSQEITKKELWDEDYENIYIGLWDCMADDNDELEFKRGEMVHIISKEYDTFSWWIGEKNNTIGLVPKDYLMKAYMI